jgi:hypothetical protein
LTRGRTNGDNLQIFFSGFPAEIRCFLAPMVFSSAFVRPRIRTNPEVCREAVVANQNCVLGAKIMRNAEQESPSTLVAIVVAARRAGDRELEKDARRKLEERFGVKLNFPRVLQDEKGMHYVE